MSICENKKTFNFYSLLSWHTLTFSPYTIPKTFIFDVFIIITNREKSYKSMQKEERYLFFVFFFFSGERYFKIPYLGGSCLWSIDPLFIELWTVKLSCTTKPARIVAVIFHLTPIYISFYFLLCLPIFLKTWDIV